MRAPRAALTIAIALTGAASLSARTPAPTPRAAPLEAGLPRAKSDTRLVGDHVLDSPAIVDTEHARQVQAVGIVRSFQAADRPPPDDLSHEQVLVKLDVATGVAAGTPFGCSDVDVVPRGTGDRLLGQQTTALLRDAMTAAGYTPLEDVAPWFPDR